MLWPKKNSYKKFDNEKKFLRLENSPLPHNFSNGPSLNHFHSEPLEIKENSKASEHGAEGHSFCFLGCVCTSAH